MKTLWKSLIFIGLFIFNLCYDLIWSSLFTKLGIDVKSLGMTWKVIINVLIDLSFMIILYFLYRKEIKREFRSFKNNFFSDMSFGFKWWAIGIIIMGTSNIIIKLIYGMDSASQNETVIQNAISNIPIYMIFSSCIYAPFCEELIFRKALKKCFNHDYMFIISSGLIFGFIHVMLSDNSLNQLLYIIPYGTFGCVFGYMYARTKNIFTSMSWHFIHNTLLIILSLLKLGVF